MLAFVRVLAFSALSVFVLILSLSGHVSSQSAAATANDVAILQFALTLEHLEATYYALGVATLSASAFAAAGFNSTVYAYLNVIASQEAQHVAALTAALGTNAVPACTYNFSAAIASPTAFLTAAAIFENTGTSAYDGVINGITSPAYATVAATIASVEARHTSWFNYITGINPVPYTFQPAGTVAGTITAVTPYIVTCPYNVSSVLSITVRPGGVALSASGAIVATGPSLTGAAPVYTVAQRSNDMNVLQYALVLENLEAAFYANFIAGYTLTMWTTAGYSAASYSYLQMITAQEAVHASTLNMTITMRGGVPIAPCAYNFTSITSILSYLQVAMALETTGVTAYDGAVAFITDTTLEQVAATIAAVEGRHTALINVLLNQTQPVPYPAPFPQVFDTANSPTTVVGIVMQTGFLGTCPQLSALVLPVQLATTSGVQGDPSFTGFHGQTFQVHGIPSRHFNLLSTAQLQMSATFTMLQDGESMTQSQQRQARLINEMKRGAQPLPLTTAYSHEGTFLSAIGIKTVGKRLLVEAGSFATGLATAAVDGKAIKVSSKPLSLGAGVSITRPTPSILRVQSPEFTFELVNSDRFLNIQSAAVHAVDTDKVEGLLGQTANPEWQVSKKRSFREHMVMDYLIQGDLFDDDFVANRYNGANDSVVESSE